MNRTIAVCGLVALQAFLAAATAAEMPAELTRFIEPGSKLVEFAADDLNGDGTPDYIVVVQRGDETGRRSLLVVTRDEKGLLTLAKRNDRIVGCESCGGAMGDPYQGTAVKENGFVVSNAGGSIDRSAYSRSIEEEATINVGPHSLRIDTARYDLAAGVRAFGIDVESAYGQGCVDGGLGPSRTLFIQEGKVLRPVLEDFYLSTWRFVQDVSTCAGGAQLATTETISYAIGIGQTVSNGFPDLRITAMSSYSNGAKSMRKPPSYELRYDGKVYPTETSFNGAAGKIDQWTR